MKEREPGMWSSRYEGKLKRLQDVSQRLIIGQGDRINMLLNSADESTKTA